jgi:hypothetical protein
MQMRVKDGVIFDGVKGHILRAMHLIEKIMEATGQYCITSVTDGKHGPNSLHYVGLAMDLRTRHLGDMDNVNMVALSLRGELGGMYEVIVEKDHIHIEASDKWLAANGDPRKAV